MQKAPRRKLHKNLANLGKRSNKRSQTLLDVELNAIASYKGAVKELEAALGMLRLGDHIGWKALLIIHNKRTIRNYEEILNISVRELFPEVGPSAQRSAGYFFAQKISNYWKAVSGDIKVENRGEITD